MPTDPVVTFSGRHLVPLKDPDSARRDVLHLDDGTYQAGQVVGEISSPGGTYGAYDSGNNDGTENPTHILEYDCIFDSGLGYIGDTIGGEWRSGMQGVPAYRNGLFDTSELVNMDSDAVTALNGHLIKGDLNNGQLLIPG